MASTNGSTAKRKARQTTKVPGYLLHKPSGKARVRLNGVDHYLGTYGSEESLHLYSKILAEHVASSGANLAKPNQELSINELALAYILHAKKYYMKERTLPNGKVVLKVTDEVGCIQSALKHLIALYGDTDVNEFGPIALKACREKMIGEKWTRRFINMSVGRIRRMFKWGVENEIVDPNILMKLKAVAPLLAGRTNAKEHTPRSAVPEDALAKVKSKVSARIRDLIDLWLLTGARPGELVKITGNMIDRSLFEEKGVWIAELLDHKMAHKGQRRIIIFGSKSISILQRHLKRLTDPSKRIFPINRATASDAMKKACRELGIPVFTAHWLRHTAATRFRENYSLDAAQALLGHAKAETTELYARLNLSKAVEVARDSG